MWIDDYDLCKHSPPAKQPGATGYAENQKNVRHGENDLAWKSATVARSVMKKETIVPHKRKL